MEHVNNERDARKVKLHAFSPRLPDRGVPAGVEYRCFPVIKSETLLLSCGHKMSC